LKLPETLAARGDQLIHLTSVCSTMLEAQQRLATREGQTLWIVADEQTAGRGRLERSWSSPPGNLYLTVVMDAPAPLRILAKAGYAVGLALHQAASELRGTGEGLRLKWPNDLLLNGAKVSGLLMEAHDAGRTLSVGMGLNLVSHPEDMPYAATHLSSGAGIVGRDEAFETVARNLILAISTFAGGDGFAEIRARWLALAAMLDEPITIRLPNRTLSGIHRGIDHDGRLVLEIGNGTVLIDAGDVFPLDMPAIPSHQTG
jgi:BirA family transcriptional regulator, biotin operon repressor / biotin---[acetyl-CoA-carboxylase] ligase